MKSKVFNFQSIKCEAQPLEILEQESFRPHYGNTCVFVIRNGIPLITIGPHWPLSLCLLISILLIQYFISTELAIYRPILLQIISVVSGINLAVHFILTVLKNPGMNIATEYSYPTKEVTCKPCGMVVEDGKGIIHCLDCDICVRQFDHHCPWVGKCIGEGNMFNFQCFVLSFFIFFVVNIYLVWQ